MKIFTYTIKDAKGIHARPAAILVREAKKFNSTINITTNDKIGDLKRIFSVMSLGVTVGTTITITLEGDDEEPGFLAIKNCLEINL
ncbi:MAG: HPr family phosphocarrier protein [Acidaminococcaceae bacterium]|nr:HPr family phosphocarrier protein [Acidaminococcaceae bacterium]MDD4721958.1 HPr family phosphocarrier protein [Acidaminococcaceae bacterium]